MQQLINTNCQVMLFSALISPVSAAALDLSSDHIKSSKGLTTDIQEIKCLKIFLHLLFFKLAHFCYISKLIFLCFSHQIIENIFMNIKKPTTQKLSHALLSSPLDSHFGVSVRTLN